MCRAKVTYISQFAVLGGQEGREIMEKLREKMVTLKMPPIEPETIVIDSDVEEELERLVQQRNAGQVEQAETIVIDSDTEEEDIREERDELQEQMQAIRDWNFFYGDPPPRPRALQRIPTRPPAKRKRLIIRWDDNEYERYLLGQRNWTDTEKNLVSFACLH